MASETIVKHICDRCGEFVERESSVYPADWQHMVLGQTGAHLDLCNVCNVELVVFLSTKGAENMKLACINEREIL